jgi:hypothetical protein
MTKFQIQKKTQKGKKIDYEEFQISTKKNFENLDKNVSKFEKLLDSYDPEKINKMIKNIPKKDGYLYSIDVLFENGYRSCFIDTRVDDLKVREFFGGNGYYDDLDPERNHTVYAVYVRATKVK